MTVALPTPIWKMDVFWQFVHIVYTLVGPYILGFAHQVVVVKMWEKNIIR